MRRPFLFLFLVAAMPAFGCVQTFFLDPPVTFVDERTEAAVSGLCGSTAVPFQPLVRVEGTTVILDFAQEAVGLAVPTSWGERVLLPRLFAGQYAVVVQIMGDEVAQQTLVVRDRPFRITPAFGDPGQKVLIEGVAIDAVCPLIHCAFLGVFFGDVPAAAIEEIGDLRLLVTVPPGSGLVDVRVELRFGDPVTLPDGFSYGEAPEPAWERVLFPVNFFGAGAHGSFWRTSIHARNDAPVNVAVKPMFFPTPTSGGVIGGGFEFIPALARGVFESQERDGGEFLYVPRGLDAPLTYVAHIVDQSRSTTDLGVEMPLVRADDTSHTIRLLEVPVEERYRAKLRVYDYDAANGRRVSVRFTDAEGTLLGTRQLTLTGVPVCVTTPCFADRPAFGVLDLDQLPELRGQTAVDVTVESLTHDGRIWAFVSVTSNDTQAVTLYSPQHRTRAQ